jgi:hypothetical protein
MRILIGKTVMVLGFVAGSWALFTIFLPGAAAEKLLKSPEVTHTGNSPTGYSVTFR